MMPILARISLTVSLRDTEKLRCRPGCQQVHGRRKPRVAAHSLARRTAAWHPLTPPTCPFWRHKMLSPGRSRPPARFLASWPSIARSGVPAGPQPLRVKTAHKRPRL